MNRILQFAASFIVAAFVQGSPCAAQNPSAEPDGNVRCAMLELYVRNDSAECADARKVFEQFAKRPGIQGRTFNLDQPGPHVDRYRRILKFFGLESADTPVVYGCNSLLINLKGTESTIRRLNSLVTVDVYVRSGCMRCADAKRFLASIKSRYPGMPVEYHDVLDNPSVRERIDRLAMRYRKQAVSVPVIHFCNQLVVGWNGDDVTGSQIRTELDQWTTPCERKHDPHPSRPSRESDDEPQSMFPADAVGPQIVFVSHRDDARRADSKAEAFPDADSGTPRRDNDDHSPQTGSADDEPLPISEDRAPIPFSESDNATNKEFQDSASPKSNSGTIDVPVFGRLNKDRLGMPAFTFLIGLVDGFNPCAMWVLLFLLSVLVNIRSRARIFAVAGTFVIVSGLAYYAFMAAWLNVFLLVGYLRWAQILLGLIAVGVGAVHIKDFFAFHRGITFSIPESAKPGIYARVRRIVNAENISGAIVGAVTLAILVNIIELLCTAGLPALYTEVLTLQGYPAWQNYLYLGLYNVAYMLDDSILVLTVVATLGRHKLQEHEGRWLKLLSGSVILGLGLVMIFKPDLLI
ncbi:MAG: glutaredoxin domain-containing protein [Planctomycetaceae bacterium]